MLRRRYRYGTCRIRIVGVLSQWSTADKKMMQYHKSYPNCAFLCHTVPLQTAKTPWTILSNTKIKTQSLWPLNHCYKHFCFTARCVQPAYARTFRVMVTFAVGMLGFCVWEPRETTTPFVVAKITQLTQCQVKQGLNAKHFVRVVCSNVAMFCVSSTCQMCAEPEWPLRSRCHWHSCLAHKSRTLAASLAASVSAFLGHFLSSSLV